MGIRLKAIIVVPAVISAGGHNDGESQYGHWLGCWAGGLPWLGLPLAVRAGGVGVLGLGLAVLAWILGGIDGPSTWSVSTYAIDGKRSVAKAEPPPKRRPGPSPWWWRAAAHVRIPCILPSCCWSSLVAGAGLHLGAFHGGAVLPLVQPRGDPLRGEGTPGPLPRGVRGLCPRAVPRFFPSWYAVGPKPFGEIAADSVDLAFPEGETAVRNRK